MAVSIDSVGIHPKQLVVHQLRWLIKLYNIYFLLHLFLYLRKKSESPNHSPVEKIGQRTRRLRSFSELLAAAALCLLPQNSNAATATSSFQVQITIQAACAINSATTLDFGTQGVLAANVDATSTITVQCTLLTPYSIGLDEGGGTGATVAARLMSDTITYSLYRDATRLLVWGHTTGVGGDVVTGAGTGLAIGHTVYGRVPPQTTPAPGLYTDTINVTVTF